MMLSDCLRAETHEIRDRIERVAAAKKDLLARALAAEEGFKRTRGNLKIHRNGEGQQSAAAGAIQQQIVILKIRLDDVERQRSEILESIFGEETKLQDSRSQLAEAHRRTQEAETRSSEALREAEELKRDLRQLEENESRHARDLHQATARAFERYVVALGDRLRKAFAGDATRRERDTAKQALRRARNEDSEIGRVCDEVDQIRALLEQATVPAVRDLLDKRRREIEALLAERFPGATLADSKEVATVPVEQFYYFVGSDNEVRIVLPFGRDEWEALSNGKTGAVETGCYRVAWALVRFLGLKPDDGGFALVNGKWEIATSLAADDLEAAGEAISVEGVHGLSLVLSRLPRDVEEAIAHEDSNR